MIFPGWAFYGYGKSQERVFYLSGLSGDNILISFGKGKGEAREHGLHACNYYSTTDTCLEGTIKDIVGTLNHWWLTPFVVSRA